MVHYFIIMWFFILDGKKENLHCKVVMHWLAMISISSSRETAAARLYIKLCVCVAAIYSSAVKRQSTFWHVDDKFDFLPFWIDELKICWLVVLDDHITSHQQMSKRIANTFWTWVETFHCKPIPPSLIAIYAGEGV